MTFAPKLIVDATKKGSVARFVNHSCEPNCEMVMWLVNGRPRMALFAKKDGNGIEVGDELTYDYNFE
jgi:SET domain-containing protein